MGAAWERRAMCESAFTVLPCLARSDDATDPHACQALINLDLQLHFITLEQN